MTRWSEKTWQEWKSRKSQRARDGGVDPAGGATSALPRAAHQSTPPGASPAAPSRAPGVRGPYIIPMPPTVNHSTGPTGNGGRYLTEEHRQFRADVATIVGKCEPLKGRLQVEITLIPRDRRVWDIDNRIKSTLDAAQRANVFVSDWQIDRLYVERDKPRRDAGGFAIVKVSEL